MALVILWFCVIAPAESPLNLKRSFCTFPLSVQKVLEEKGCLVLC